MDPTDTLPAALAYPWDGGDRGVTLVVGGILTLLSPLVVPGLFVLGYGLRVVEARLDDREGPPRFTDWGSLLVTGLKGAVVLVVYVVFPLFVGAAVLAGLAAATGRPFPGGAIVGFGAGLGAAGLLLVLVLLFAGLALALSYLAPAALLHLGRTGRLSAAFAVDDVLALAGAAPYGAAWLLALAVFAAAGVVLAVLNAAAIGVVVSGFVTFYAFVAMAYLYAGGAEAAGYGREAGTEDADGGTAG